jgi:uncharacterized membrane protein YqaE (UPF0057 family)
MGLSWWTSVWRLFPCFLAEGYVTRQRRLIPVLPEWTEDCVHKRCLPWAITRIQLCNPHPLRSTSHTSPLPTTLKTFSPTPPACLSPDRECRLPSPSSLPRPPVSRNSSGNTNIDARTDLYLSDIVKIIIAILLPPLGVFLERGCGADLLINILLTILGYIPGIIHALYVTIVLVLHSMHTH